MDPLYDLYRHFHSTGCICLEYLNDELNTGKFKAVSRFDIDTVHQT